MHLLKTGRVAEISGVNSLPLRESLLRDSICLAKAS